VRLARDLVAIIRQLNPTISEPRRPWTLLPEKMPHIALISDMCSCFTCEPRIDLSRDQH
jgi:hypothetical protein